MIRAEYGGKLYKLIDTYSIKKSLREVTFNNLKLDFTECTMEDIPFKYQEIHIGKYTNGVEKERIFTGYINTVVLPNMKNKHEFRELEIEILSPMALASKKSVSAIGTYHLQGLIQHILEPLIVEGFEIVEMNLSNPQVTVNFLLETVENCLNKLSNNNDFWWYIDENKGIHINDLSYQFNLKPKLIYDKKLEGVVDLTPSIDATDYCNIVNFINVRVYNYSYDFHLSYGTINPIELDLYSNPLFDKTIKINKGNTVDFTHPVDITPANIVKSVNAHGDNNMLDSLKNYALHVNCKDKSGVDKSFYIRTDGTSLIMSNNLSFGGDGSESETTTDFELIRDSFFSNLIVGFKYNGDKSITQITSIKSCSALMWTRMRFVNNKEIERCKGKISVSGQIEKIINMNEQWKTTPELKQIADSYININSSQTDKIKLKIDKNYNLKIGDIIRIDRPEFLTQNNYIITDMLETKISKDIITYEYDLRNSNYLENFVDLFRTAEEQQNDEKNYNLVVSDYIEDGLKEVHEVV